MKDSEFERRLREQAERARVTLPPHFPAKAKIYYELLSQWNRITNLTALQLDSYPPETLNRLLIEPLQAAEFVQAGCEFVCVDVGSGGGSPAIPLAIARPLIHMIMVESVVKKGAFLREACRLVGLQGAEVITARAEDLVAERPQFADLLLVRGVRLDEALVLALSRFIKTNGRLFAFGSSPREVSLSNWRVSDRLKLSTDSELVIFQTSVR